MERKPDWLPGFLVQIYCNRKMYMKRTLAVLLCAIMVLTSLPLTALAQESPVDTRSDSIVAAQELPGESRLETPEAQPEEAPYEPDEIVTVIVEMAEKPVLDGFQKKSSTLSAGEQVGQYLASSTAAVKQEVILDTQAAVIQSLGRDANVVAQWTNVVNGFAVEIPYGQLEKLQSMDGVVRAYVEHVYDRPDETMSENTAIGGTHGYSYNLIGVGDAWAAGYTGKGMLVAVLDTGLDITYTTWGDSSNPQRGVRRVHEAFTENSFMNDPSGWDLRYTEESMRLFLENAPLWATNRSTITYDGNALYKNLKVPYAYDYADVDLNVVPMDSDHGTHVSGTIAGYAETEEGEVLFSGVAPDAQILSMKVFPDADGGAQESSIYCALEDAATLGADVMNLSLGSDNGFAKDGSLASDAYKRISATGILFMVSAGNAGNSAGNSNYGDENLASDPEISMISSPSVYGDNLSVASFENSVTTRSALLWYTPDGVETKISFQDPNEIAMKYKFAGNDPVNIIPVDGYGTYNDYYNAGFRGYYGYGDKGETGIALVKRGGGLSFVDKINNAMSFSWSYYNPELGYYVTEYPVKAVIIYDEDPTSTDLIYMSVDGAAITSCYISGKDGAALYDAAKAAMAEGQYVTLTVQEKDDVIESPDAGQMSSFSSWGAGPALELKPEITAPGGNIWSTVLDQRYSPANPGGAYDDYTGSYGMMSGTSMASPHMTGVTALVEQYIYAELGLTSKVAVGNLAQMLMVSTAIPQKNPNGVYYTPRQQGAGLVNVANAIATPAYISVDGQNVGKLELKDDPDRTGSYEMTFKVHNLTGEALTYNATAYVLRPGTEEAETYWGDRSFMQAEDVLLKEVDLGEITVPASGNVIVRKTVTLTAEEKQLLDELFPNGTYVEGFIVLTNDTDPQIGLPFLAFYGDWTAAPIFDSATWLDNQDENAHFLEQETQWGVSLLGFYDGYSFRNFGQNPFDPVSEEVQNVYHPENVTLGATVFNTVNDFVLYQKREAKAMVVEVRNADTGELYYRDHTGYQFKTYYDYSYGMALPSSVYYFTNTNWAGQDLNGQPVPDGTKCVMTITAYGDGEYPTTYRMSEAGTIIADEDIRSIIPGEKEPTFNGHAMDKTGDVITMPITVDRTAPVLKDSTVSIMENEEGRLIMTGTFEDDGALASIEIFPQVKRTYKEGYGNPGQVDYALDYNNPFYSEMIYDAAAHTWTFSCDVTDYAHTVESYPGENYYYDFTWTGNIFIYGGDYGGNDRAYAVTAKSDSGLVLSTTSALLKVGQTFDLSVINNTGSDAPLTRTSSNPEVATVDEFGHIVAVAPGQTTVTISNGTDSAVCIVAVREPNTEVIDFELAIDSFSGLTPNGTIIVKAINLRPADVELTEVKWLVTEDDPDLYEGLINCAQYDTSGLAAEIYLNTQATGDPDLKIPGASGTLTVTLNGVTRTMHLDWEDLYTKSDDDDLVSGLPFYDQSRYVTQGETATLIAMYNNRNAHNFVPVKFATLKDYVDYSYDNVLDAPEGLILDGPEYCNAGAVWSGKLVNTEGYALPESIRVFTRYDSGYEYEITNYWYNEISYNNQTGEIRVGKAPEYGSLLIRADGVVSEGNPAGQVSGATYEKPDGLYGPFDWEVVSGNGKLEVKENVNYNNSIVNLAEYTPAEPGCSIIKATSRDGKYSLNFAVVSQAILPEVVSLDTTRLTLHVAETYEFEATLSPEPTLERHEALTWTSYNPEVATVDETGKLTAVAPGYAFVTAVSDYTGAIGYCVVEVLACEHAKTTTVTTEATCTQDGSVVTTCDLCGQVLSEEILPMGHTYEAVVTAPTCTEGGYTTYTCAVCGDSYVADHTEALGHSFEDTVVEATCTESGYTTYTCSVCGYTYRDAFVPANSENCPSEAFKDLADNQWYHEGVDFVLRSGLMKGMSEDVFAPNNNMTRAQLVMVLYRMAGCPEAKEDAAFKDVAETAWYAEAVAWAVENGITKGVSEDYFNPNDSVTREQMVTFFARFAALNGQDVEVEGDLSAFTDGTSVSKYAARNMVWAVKSGLIEGMGDNTINPKGNATRAQVATILMRYCKTFG